MIGFIVPVWVDSAVAGATPIKDTYAVRLYGTARNTLGDLGTGFNYAISTTDEWTNFVIDCQVLPVTMSQAVTWEVVGPDPGIISVAASGTNRLVSRGTGTGEATIKVTSTGSTTVSHRPLAEFKVKIALATDNIDSVTITAPADGHSMNTVGQTVALTAAIYPGTSPQGVTWAVWANEDGTGATTLASIQGGNTLRVDVLPGTTTNVYLIATSVQDGTKSSAARAVEIRAVPVGGTTVHSWRFSVARAIELGLVGDGAATELFPLTGPTNFGNGLTVSTNRDAHIRTQATNSGWGDYAASFGSGVLSMGHNVNLGDWATLTGIPAGEVKVTVKFSGTGGANWNRNPNFRFGATGTVHQFTACPDAAANTDPTLVITTDQGNASNTLYKQTLTVMGNGSDIIFNGTGNFRLWELVVEFDNP